MSGSHSIHNHTVADTVEQQRATSGIANLPLDSPLVERLASDDSSKPSSAIDDIHVEEYEVKKRTEPRFIGSTDRIGEVEKSVVLKTDLVLIPMMGIAVLLQYLDKAILSYAALLGMTKELKLVSNEYSWAASIYYFGYIAGLPLWCIALQRFTPDRVVGAGVFFWGIACCCHAAASDYAGILAVRFFLGTFEAAMTPSFIIIIGYFYKKQETPLRTAGWYSFGGLSLIIGGCMSWSLLGKSKSQLQASSVPVWKQLYLILGSITITYGILIWFLMPNNPLRTRLYTADQHVVAMERTKFNSQPDNEELLQNGTMRRHFLEAWRDVRIYIIFLGMCAGSIPTGGITAYSLQLLSGFGFTVSESLLLTIAPGGAQIFAVLLFVIFTSLSRSRAVGAMTVLIPAIAGGAIMHASNVSKVPRAAGYTLLNMGAPAITAIYSITSSGVSGHGKKLTFAGVGQLAYAIGNIIGPLTFLAEEAPAYHTAKMIIIACLCVALAALSSILLIHVRWNYQRGHRGLSPTPEPARAPCDDEQEATGREQSTDDEMEDEIRNTDFADRRFRYVY